MNLIERRMEVFRHLQQEGIVNINDFAEQLGVSSMTVRRDLQYFSQQGLVTISNGNAYLVEGASDDVVHITMKQEENGSKKQRIGRAAAELVENGDTIIVDCGTTTLQLLRFLGNKRVTVFTNSIPVAGFAGDMANLTIVYAPGVYSPQSVGMVGTLASDFFRTLHVDKSFLGAHGFDAAGGTNEPVLDDAATKHTMLDAAQASYLMVDSGKYGNVHLMAASKLSDYTCVITDGDFPQELRPELEAACQQVIYA